MEYRRFDHTIVARLDKGEEILEQVKTIALQEHITLATVQALGAINAFTVGVFYTDEKEYHANEFTGHFEIVSLSGTYNGPIISDHSSKNYREHGKIQQ